MILSPLLRHHLRPYLCSWLTFRTIRPSVKIGKDKFQLSIDVHQFKKEELRVKAREEFVIIEGKQEKNTKQGFMTRQFVRKYKLPEGCSPKNMQSELSPEGILTITARRRFCEHELPYETLIPISNPETKKEADIVKVNDVKPNPCDKFIK